MEKLVKDMTKKEVENLMDEMQKNGVPVDFSQDEKKLWTEVTVHFANSKENFSVQVGDMVELKEKKVPGVFICVIIDIHQKKIKLMKLYNVLAADIKSSSASFWIKSSGEEKYKIINVLDKKDREKELAMLEKN